MSRPRSAVLAKHGNARFREQGPTARRSRLRAGCAAALALFAALAGAPLAANPAVARERGAEPVLALVGGTVIDGTGRPPAARQTILVRGDRIAAVGSDIKIPQGARIIDVSGKTVIPGLIDMHGHMYVRGSGRQQSQFEAYSLLFLAGGVTTVRSPGDFDPAGMIATREAIAAGRMTGPRIFTAGPYFDHHPSQVSWIEGGRSPAEAIRKFEEWKTRIDYVKVYANITEGELSAILAAAHRRGKKVTGHLGSVTAGKAVDLGIDGLEHGIFAMPEFVPDNADNKRRFCALAALDLDSPEVDGLIDRIVAKRVVVDPTIVTYQSLHPGFVPVTGDWLRYFAPGARAYQEQRLATPREGDPERDKCLAAAIARQLAFVGRVHARGGVVVAGTDPVVVTLTPGYALHRELKNFVLAGFAPVEAIRAATLVAATALGRQKDLGSIERGKLADMAVVTGDPATHIEDVGNTEIVLKGGRVYEPVILRQAAEGKIE